MTTIESLSRSTAIDAIWRVFDKEPCRFRRLWRLTMRRPPWLTSKQRVPLPTYGDRRLVSQSRCSLGNFVEPFRTFPQSHLQIPTPRFELLLQGLKLNCNDVCAPLPMTTRLLPSLKN